MSFHLVSRIVDFLKSGRTFSISLHQFFLVVHRAQSVSRSKHERSFKAARNRRKKDERKKTSRVEEEEVEKK